MDRTREGLAVVLTRRLTLNTGGFIERGTRGYILYTMPRGQGIGGHELIMVDFGSFGRHFVAPHDIRTIKEEE